MLISVLSQQFASEGRSYHDRLLKGFRAVEAWRTRFEYALCNVAQGRKV